MRLVDSHPPFVAARSADPAGQHPAGAQGFLHTLAGLFLAHLKARRRLGEPDERYLAGARDHADLERRQRALERIGREANFVVPRD